MGASSAREMDGDSEDEEEEAEDEEEEEEEEEEEDDEREEEEDVRTVLSTTACFSFLNMSIGRPNWPSP